MYKILNSDIIYMAYCFNGCRIYMDIMTGGKLSSIYLVNMELIY